MTAASTSSTALGLITSSVWLILIRERLDLALQGRN
ncbi:hypothetical protein F0726_02000 [Acidithiobacillus caldus]|nr:hypothetical protein F0726_02000 [Acidithiobacillus caldus]